MQLTYRFICSYVLHPDHFRRGAQYRSRHPGHDSGVTVHKDDGHHTSPTGHHTSPTGHHTSRTGHHTSRTGHHTSPTGHSAYSAHMEDGQRSTEREYSTGRPHSIGRRRMTDKRHLGAGHRLGGKHYRGDHQDSDPSANASARGHRNAQVFECVRTSARLWSCFHGVVFVIINSIHSVQDFGNINYFVNTINNLPSK